MIKNITNGDINISLDIPDELSDGTKLVLIRNIQEIAKKFNTREDFEKAVEIALYEMGVKLERDE